MSMPVRITMKPAGALPLARLADFDTLLAAPESRLFEYSEQGKITNYIRWNGLWFSWTA
jgi:hypothetical protein